LDNSKYTGYNIWHSKDWSALLYQKTETELKIMSRFILFAKDSRKITVRQLEFSQKRTIGSTKNKTTTIFCSSSFFFSAGITITKNYLRKKYIDSGRDRAFLNLVSLVRSCVGSLAAVF